MEMEMEMEMEDDLFFADLNKQISLLIMDDDGDVALSPLPWYSYPPPHQDTSYLMGSTQVTQVQGQGQQPRRYHHVQEKKNHHQHQELGMSKGTGVFIPKFAQPRRKRTTTFNPHHHQTRHNNPNNSNNNYSSSPPNYHHHYSHQHADYYTTRRFSKEESCKANNYFINPA